MAYDKDSRDSRDSKSPRGGNRKRRKVCAFCAEKSQNIDYKDTAKIRRFLSERSKILPRRATGTCAMHQRELTDAIKRARTIALLPYVTD
jgi:small subunit ribosomal protein S18